MIALELHLPDVLLNFSTATGFTGAITKTPSHSAAPLPGGFICVITKTNISCFISKPDLG